MEGRFKMDVLILAAGMGERMQSITPKSLIKFSDGTSSLYRILDYCSRNQAVGSISVIIGYNSSMFDQIKALYPDVKFIYNNCWDCKSNMYSMLIGLNSFSKDPDELLVMDADTVFRSEDIFVYVLSHLENFAKENQGTIVTIDKVNSSEEWIVTSDSTGEVRSIITAEDNSISKRITSGITFWRGKSVKKLHEMVAAMSTDEDNFYWDLVYMPSAGRSFLTTFEMYIPGYLMIHELDRPMDLVFVNRYFVTGEDQIFKRIYV